VTGVSTISVVIPAHDEQATIQRCLQHVAAARERAISDGRVSVRVVVVADACTDATAQLARAAGADVVELSLRDVGHARRAGVDHALRVAHGRQLHDHWLACTDADSLVPRHWLTHQLALATQGADMVLGTVSPYALPTELADAWRARHTLAEGHPHVHGANLGVRGSTYLAVGGFLPGSVGEDVDLARRVRASGSTWSATDRIRVATHGRRVSRVVGGFATYLDDLGREVLCG